MSRRVEIREGVTLFNGQQKIFGILHRPSDISRAPLVIFLHGFASNKIGTNRYYVTFAQKLIELGIASFRFDFRGSGDSEGDLSTLTFHDLIEDARAVFHSAMEFPTIDPQRIAFFGSSMGGTIGVLAAPPLKDLAAIALWSPLASGELWVRDFLAKNPDKAKDPEAFFSNFRGVTLNPTFQQEFFHMSTAEALDTIQHIPLLHMQGKDDHTVSFLHQELYKQHCAHRQVPAQFLSFSETEHCLGTAAVFPVVVQETMKWLKQNLVEDVRELV